jgi:hypothetical protein
MTLRIMRAGRGRTVDARPELGEFAARAVRRIAPSALSVPLPRAHALGKLSVVHTAHCTVADIPLYAFEPPLHALSIRVQHLTNMANTFLFTCEPSSLLFGSS